MIRYVPFLKAKRGELTAMAELAPAGEAGDLPILRLPAQEANYDRVIYVASAKVIVTSLKKHWGADAEFYFDDFDIDQKLTVKGEHQYAYLLKALQGAASDLPSCSRPHKTQRCRAQLKRDDEIASGSPWPSAPTNSDFEDFDDSEDQIDYDLANVFKQFEAIDLILDCRRCTGMDVPGNLAANRQPSGNSATPTKGPPRDHPRFFHSRFLGDVVTEQFEAVARRELAILPKRATFPVEMVGGDYATVSPLLLGCRFRPESFQKVTGPR